jgi:hypothetical protein
MNWDGTATYHLSYLDARLQYLKQQGCALEALVADPTSQPREMQGETQG